MLVLTRRVNQSLIIGEHSDELVVRVVKICPTFSEIHFEGAPNFRITRSREEKVLTHPTTISLDRGEKLHIVATQTSDGEMTDLPQHRFNGSTRPEFDEDVRIDVMLISIHDGNIQLGIDAPRATSICRGEIHRAE